MKRLLAVGALVVGAAIAFQALSRVRRGQLTAKVRARMAKRMERMIASLPEGSPPRLVMSILPQLRDQNDEILRMLREHAKHCQSAGAQVRE